MDGIVSDFELSTDRNGKVIQSLGNCVKAIGQDKNLANMFSLNEFTNKLEISGAWWRRTSKDISENDLNNIRLFLETKYGLTHEKNIPRSIELIAHQNAYHPIRKYLESRKWNGGKYIENLLPRYLGAKKSDYTTYATLHSFLCGIKRIYDPGAKIDEMLCIVGKDQGDGKSSLVRFIAVYDEWFTDDLKNLDDENIYRKLQGHWVIEMSEMLATANSKSIESIKSFLSRQKDTYKIPYDRYAQDIPRQCIFIGTTNNLDFLPNDKSGNRRFIPVLVDGKKAEVHPLENEVETRAFINQCWAEAMEIYRSGNYSLTFPKELQGELLEAQQRFTPEDSKVGVIQEWLDGCEYDSVCSRMIFKEAFDMGLQEPREWELREISNIMNRSITGWERHPTSDSKVRFAGYGKQRAWDRIVPGEEVPEGFVRVSDNRMNSESPFD